MKNHTSIRQAPLHSHSAHGVALQRMVAPNQRLIRRAVRPVLRRPYGTKVASSGPLCQVATKRREAVLCTKVKAHDAALTAGLVLVDQPGCKKFLTASLDKKLSLWTVENCDITQSQISKETVSPTGAPIFSLCLPPKTQDAEQLVYCGTASKEILFWDIADHSMSQKDKLNGHTGWVRSLATHGKYLFSCGCNYLRQWDTTFAVPKEIRSMKLFKEDILCITAHAGKIFTCGADGSLRSWKINKQGDLTESASREKAHDGRVTQIVAHNSILYSVSYDGALKAWDAETLELVMTVKGAHDGARIQAMTIGPDGILYTGGDDQLVRRWEPAVLEQFSEPLHCHNAPIKTLVSGSSECVLSGDSAGTVGVWVV